MHSEKCILRFILRTSVFGLSKSSAAVVSNALAGYWVGSALLSLRGI